MSFPRVVPTAERKVNKRIRNLLLRGSLAYTVGFYGVGEYFGWWNKFDLPHYDDQNPEHVLHSVQGEDERSWQRITQKFTNRTMAESRRIVDKHFVQNLPIGMQNIINNPEWQVKEKKDEASSSSGSEYIEIYDKAPGFAPTLVKKEDLVTFTSSKSASNSGQATEAASS